MNVTRWHSGPDTGVQVRLSDEEAADLAEFLAQCYSGNDSVGDQLCDGVEAVLDPKV